MSSSSSSTGTSRDIGPTSTPNNGGGGGGTNGSGSGGGNGNGTSDDSSTSRPLLFFVALGFGVVFTNLWIIVGVKYCFRYNQRNRQGAIDRETGEPIDLANMPRPRRRKEKKLMTMEEVNERFPLTKYKIWRAAREQEGLPTTGGVTAPPSRAASIKEVMIGRNSTEPDNRASVELASRDSKADVQGFQSSDTKDFAENAPAGSSGAVRASEEKTTNLGASPHGTGMAAQSTSLQQVPAVVEDDDDDDPIRTAVPAELLQQPGDACAICIDTIEDEDEVRGLTCGHAFHAGCLDPWLTSRRACCPLCKADYFIPKARPEGETEGADGTRRDDPVALPANVWLGGRAGVVAFRPRLLFSNSRFSATSNERWRSPPATREGRFRPARRQGQPVVEDGVEAQAQGSEQDQNAPQDGRAARFASRLRSIPSGFRPSRNRGTGGEQASAAQQPPETEQQTTPSQLEAGTR